MGMCNPDKEKVLGFLKGETSSFSRVSKSADEITKEWSRHWAIWRQKSLIKNGRYRDHDEFHDHVLRKAKRIIAEQEVELWEKHTK